MDIEGNMVFLDDKEKRSGLESPFELSYQSAWDIIDMLREDANRLVEIQVETDDNSHDPFLAQEKLALHLAMNEKLEILSQVRQALGERSVNSQLVTDNQIDQLHTFEDFQRLTGGNS